MLINNRREAALLLGHCAEVKQSLVLMRLVSHASISVIIRIMKKV